MPRPVHWGTGLVASVALHAGAAGLYLTTHDPAAPTPQSGPESRFQLDTVTAPTQDVAAQTPQGLDTNSTPAASTPVTAGAIPQSTATPVPLTGQTAPSVANPGTTLASSTSAGQRLAQTAPTTAQLPDVPPAAAPLQPTLPQTAAVGLSIPAATVLAPAQPPTVTSSATATPSEQTPATPPNAPQLASLVTDGPTATEPPLPATTAKADTAWQFGDRLVTDPAALATIQAFMAPSQIDNATAIKDDLTDVLASIPCARISATFLPDTGTLDIQGHIPDPTMRDTVLQTMQAQVGDGIPVTANLLHLPSPQCNALTGISNVGLPQSTDQFTDDRLIGQSAHARDYSYAEGQRLQFDLAAPDYDAYVYVDYFAADGTVIHLIPNDIIPLENLPAKSLIGVGADVPGKPGLHITIAPPFGQEIAVAFAASDPLYDGLRPTVEPAEPYLAYLTQQVTKARQTNPDFKGEWVYFHMTTKPATQ